MKNQFFLTFNTMPKATAQQKGVRVVNGKPYFYKKNSVETALNLFMIGLKPHRPPKPAEGPVKLSLLFEFDCKDKRKWGTYKSTRPDCDNMAKEFIDAMSKSGFWNDDAQIAMLGITKKYAEKAQVKVWWEEVQNE